MRNPGEFKELLPHSMESREHREPAFVDVWDNISLIIIREFHDVRLELQRIYPRGNFFTRYLDYENFFCFIKKAELENGRKPMIQFEQAINYSVLVPFYFDASLIIIKKLLLHMLNLYINKGSELGGVLK